MKMSRFHAPATRAEAIFTILEKTRETASAVEAVSTVHKNSAKLRATFFGFAKYLRKNAHFFFAVSSGFFAGSKSEKTDPKVTSLEKYVFN